MTKKRINTILKTGLIGAVVLTAFPACSDTWGDHYDLAEGFQTTATATLWEQIQANGKLTQFAQILEKAHYYTDENHRVANYTFKDMLNSTQILTVWAPEDGTYDANKWLEMCETNGYAVQQQFLGNHISLWRKLATGTTADSITMLNSKRIIFDKAKQTFRDIKLDGSTVSAKNGILYTLNGAAPFQFNLYEYIKSNPEVGMLATYISNQDTTYFSSSASTEGPSDENGNPTYVDSVFFTSNRLWSKYYRPMNSEWLTYLEGFFAILNAEDSAYAMILPTDQAWQAARTKLSKYYNYADAYINKTEENNGVDEQLHLNPDSLRELCLDMDLTSPLVFNIKGQPREGIGILTKETFDEKKGQALYLLNTIDDTLYSSPIWEKTELFGSRQPVEMSNGLAYTVDQWNFPMSYYKPDITVECTYSTIFKSEALEGKTVVNTISFNNYVNTWAEETGKIYDENYLLLQGYSSAGSPNVEFKIRDLKRDHEISSGKYDIYVVMVPYYYQLNEDMREDPTWALKNRFESSITYNNGEKNGKGKVKEKTEKTKVIEYEGQKVDTILLFKDFEFPVSYKNLTDCYPTIQIRDRATASNLKNGYTHALSIDRFLFVSKED